MSKLNFMLCPCEKWDGEKWIPWHFALPIPPETKEIEEDYND